MRHRNDAKIVVSITSRRTLADKHCSFFSAPHASAMKFSVALMALVASPVLAAPTLRVRQGGFSFGSVRRALLQLLMCQNNEANGNGAPAIVGNGSPSCALLRSQSCLTRLSCERQPVRAARPACLTEEVPMVPARVQVPVLAPTRAVRISGLKEHR